MTSKKIKAATSPPNIQSEEPEIENCMNLGKTDLEAELGE